MKRVLVIAAHPDDEVLGCGGTIARHATAGDAVDVVFLTDGVSARGDQEGAIHGRRAAAQHAAKILGIQKSCFLDFPDNQLDSVPLLQVTQAVEGIFAEATPDFVYTHHGGDLNLDHRLVHQAVVTALRPLQSNRVQGIMAFETPSSTEWATPAIGAEFRPDRFVDIAPMMDRKIAALQAYAEETRPFPHPRSEEAIRALAAWRGANAGLTAAEAFVTIRWVER